MRKILLQFGLSLLVLSSQCAALTSLPAENTAAPAVLKVDPPNWWASFSPNLMLLIRGERLNSVKITTDTPDVTIGEVQSSANGHYVLLHLTIGPKVKPGTLALHLVSDTGSTDLRFPLLSRNRNRANFQGLSPDDVIYLIMPDRFADGDPANNRPPGSAAIYDRNRPQAWHGGDLRGVSDHLSYIRDLGCTAVWLTPIWKNSDGGYHGYHPVDMYSVDPHMGSMRDYQQLVATAHTMGMKVVLDFIGNHVGPDHPWAADPPTRTWFHGSLEHHSEATYNFAGLADPHAALREYRRVIEGWFVNQLPDLNTDDPNVAQYLEQNAMWWMEMSGLDAIRIDTFPYSSRKFWSDWHHQMRSIYPQLVTIGEVSDESPDITAFFDGGRAQWDGIDSGATTVFDYPLYYKLRDVLLQGAPIQRLIDVLQMDRLYARPDLLVPFIGNHDKARFMGEQGSSTEKLIAAYALLLTIRGIPELYYGDEIGMTGGDDPDNRRDFPGGFAGDAHDAFLASNRSSEEQNIFIHVQSLLRLRRAHPALRQGKQWNIGWDESYYAFLRQTSTENILVIFNNASTKRDVKIALSDTPMQGTRQLQLIFGTATATLEAGSLDVSVGASTVVIYNVSK